MRFSVVAAVVQLFAVSLAYTIAEGYIKVNDQSVYFGEFMTQEVKQLTLDTPKDKIEINLKLKEEIEKKPHQLLLSLASFNDPAIASHYVPAFTASKEIRLTISANKIPEVLKVQDKLIFKLIVADYDNEGKNLVQQLVEFIPEAEFQASSKYTEKPRIGYQPEIHHIFRGEEKTVNPAIPVIFIGGAVVLFIGLVTVWLQFIGKDLISTLKYTPPVQLTYNIGFLTSIIGFEANFISYYLGQSIFTTLFYGFILSLPSVYFGSKVLRSLSIGRHAGRF
ncbi:uncharacterized protein RJT20DRAFT_125646 [Scheffersomyces xylosifermentans]|uniref:uncharacterized protein n=1 Tax=Scheffersomyces xylosifermentans TaxID=1304137 RepID=UPI00315C54B2